MSTPNILYSFRRCPYAMRARMGIAASRQMVELREIVLRNKPEEMITASPKATVPVLVLPDNTVLDESLDIMLWALKRNDPYDWMTPEIGSKQEMLDLIELIDGAFKSHLDAYKYAPRNAPKDSDIYLAAQERRDEAMVIVETELGTRLSRSTHLFGNRQSLADIAIAPFVRQFANTDYDWFDRQAHKELKSWLENFVSSDLFASVMPKYEQWKISGQAVQFPQ